MKIDENICPHCDPEYYVVYGICKDCGRQDQQILYEQSELHPISYEDRIIKCVKSLTKAQKKFNDEHRQVFEQLQVGDFEGATEIKKTMNEDDEELNKGK
jgi:hypothetical protein